MIKARIGTNWHKGHLLLIAAGLARLTAKACPLGVDSRQEIRNLFRMKNDKDNQRTENDRSKGDRNDKSVFDGRKKRMNPIVFIMQ